jgi:hypothetical protein
MFSAKQSKKQYNVDELVHAALNQAPKQYTMARQLGLMRWLGHRQLNGISIGQNLFANQSELSRDFFTVFEGDGVQVPKGLYQIAIINTGWLSKRFDFFPVEPHHFAPNLYIAQIAGHAGKRLVFEITPDETSILQALLTYKSKTLQNLDKLTPDKNLQEAITEIWGRFTKRLGALSTPLLQGRDGFALPLPGIEAERYEERLQTSIELMGDKTLVLHEWQAGKQGDAARRLQQMGMVKDIGSVRGVFTDSSPRKSSDWVELNVIEKAQYEGRVLGSGTITLPNKRDVKVFVFASNKYQDKAKLRVLVAAPNQQWLLTVYDNDTLQTEAYKGELPPCEDTHYNQDALLRVCDAYEDGGRVPSWLKAIFDYLDKRVESVSLRTVNSFISNVLSQGT